MDVLSDGTILISTRGSASVSGASGFAEDLLAFTPSQLGPTTSGTWSLHFDGSDVELSDIFSGEDVDAAAIGPNGKYYFSTSDAFSVVGVSGEDEDVFTFTPTTLGDNTSGSFEMFFDGSAIALAGEDINAVDIPRGPFSPAAMAGSDSFALLKDGPRRSDTNRGHAIEQTVRLTIDPSESRTSRSPSPLSLEYARPSGWAGNVSRADLVSHSPGIVWVATRQRFLSAELVDRFLSRQTASRPLASTDPSLGITATDEARGRKTTERVFADSEDSHRRSLLDEKVDQLWTELPG